MDWRAGSFGLKSAELMWDRLQRIIRNRNVRSETGESLETEMIVQQSLEASAPLGLGIAGLLTFQFLKRYK